VAHGSAFSQVSLRGGFRSQLNIKDRWTSGAGGCPLRLATKTSRSTSPDCVGGGKAQVHFLLQPKAGGGGAQRSSVTEGAATERISIALADESRGARLGEAFDVVDHRRERADAGEEALNGERARWPEEGAGLLPESHLRDLAGAGADGEVEGGLVVDDQRLDMEPRARIVCEQVEALGAEHLADHQRNALPRRLDALLHRVVREERAQDDPEQLHDRHCTPAFSPADLRALYPTNSWA
jgi:hypothetical protein